MLPRTGLGEPSGRLPGEDYRSAVPRLDYALVCDFVPAEGGLAHVIAAGIDTISKEDVPSGQNVGLVLRVNFARSERGRSHRVEVLFQDEDGTRLAQIEAVVQPTWAEGLPPAGPSALSRR